MYFHLFQRKPLPEVSPSVCIHKRHKKIQLFHSYFLHGLLGGSSLHLNHLIASRMRNYNWPFETLSFGPFCSNLDTKDLETYPRTYSSHFWNMSLFGDSRATWVLFRKWLVSENQSFLDEGTIVWALISLVLGGEVPRLNHGSICCPIQNTWGVLQAVKSQVPLFWHFQEGLKCTYYWCIASGISP